MLEFKLKGKLKKAFIEAEDNKKELYRLLKCSEKLGLEWGTRDVYGGGVEVTLNDGLDGVLSFWSHGTQFGLSFNDDYFYSDYEPTRAIYYSEETLAEIRNEEALYNYEMPHYRLEGGKRRGA